MDNLMAFAASASKSDLWSQLNVNTRTLSQFLYSHEQCKIPSNPLSGVCQSAFLLLSLRCKDLTGEAPKPPHQRWSMGQCEFPPLSLYISWVHKYIPAQTQSYSVLCVSSEPAAGVWRQEEPLFWTPPLLLRLWPPLLGGDWRWRQMTACLSAPTTTDQDTQSL